MTSAISSPTSTSTSEESTAQSSSKPSSTLQNSSTYLASKSNTEITNTAFTDMEVTSPGIFNSTYETSKSVFENETNAFTKSSSKDQTTRPIATPPNTSSLSSNSIPSSTSYRPTDTSHITGDLSTSGLLTNNTEVDKLVSGDCSSAIVTTVAVAVSVWVLTLLVFAVILIKMRKKWRRKLIEERQRTDIWSMSTFHNTIINDNFMDYKLAPSSSKKNRMSDAGNVSTAHVKQSRLSSGALSRASSIYNDDYTFRQSIIRRSTLSDDERFRFSKSKSRAKRQASNYSRDSWLEPNSEFRARTSTFNVGKRNRLDKHGLVNNDELRTSKSFDGLDMLEKRSMPSRSSSQDQPYYVTEL